MLQKILDMGFISDVSVKMLRCAPLLYPIELEIQGCLVSLRKSEAAWWRLKFANKSSTCRSTKLR